MPISAGTNIILRSGQDPDALAYFSRAGIASGTQTPSSYDNAASFTSASSQSLTSTAANLQCQSQSFTVAGWFFMPSNAPTWIGLASQGSHVSFANSGWMIQRIDGNARLNFSLRNDNASNDVNVASPLFVLSTWNFVECGWDSALNQSFISINGGTRTFSTAVAGWTFPNTTNITRLGSEPFGNFLTGNLAGWGLWKKALSASEVTALWNNGAGRTYASLDSGLRTNLVSWWALNQNSVTADSHGTNTLTNNGTVTAPNIGPIITGYSDSRRLISDFVRGIKSLGLWNSMVCWPLRASQNAGSGTTAFSLGGLGQFNGTLVNAPVWGANGIRFSPATTQHINCATGNSGGFLSSTFYSSTSQLLNMVVATPYAEDGSKIATFNHGASTAGSDGIAVCVGAGNSGTYRGRYMLPNLTTRTGGNENWVWDSTDSAYLYTLNRPKSLITQVVGGVASTHADNNAPLSGAYSVLPTSFLNTCKVGAGFAASAPSGSFTIPFSLIGNLSTSTSQLYSLYKQTLGLGLGLP
jgi:hypothetical protein